MGGKKTLPIGSVCRDCNKRLSFLDRAFKYGDETMMMAYQTDLAITGRFRHRHDKGKTDRERKEAERTRIRGEGELRDTRIERSGQDINLINAKMDGRSELFVRSLHKSVANVLCNLYGSVSTRDKYPDLIKFVNEGGSWQPWSYAVSIPFPWGIDRTIPLKSEPEQKIVSIKNEILIVVLHTSGIWIIGSVPYQINPETIEITSALIAKELEIVIEPKSQKSVIEAFGMNYNNEVSYGRLRFLWRKSD